MHGDEEREEKVFYYNVTFGAMVHAGACKPILPLFKSESSPKWADNSDNARLLDSDSAISWIYAQCNGGPTKWELMSTPHTDLDNLSKLTWFLTVRASLRLLGQA